MCSKTMIGVLAGVVLAGSAGVARGQCQAEELAKVTAFDAEMWDSFGDAVAISGDIAVIGAMRDNTEQGGYQSGTARVYSFDGKQWFDEATLISSDIESGDWFGHSVAVSGDAILVGASGDGCKIRSARVPCPPWQTPQLNRTVPNCSTGLSHNLRSREEFHQCS